MAEEKEKKPKEALKPEFSVVSTKNYIILSNDSHIIEIGKGGRVHSDGVKFVIGVSFGDVNESRLRRKLEKKAVKLTDKEIDTIVAKKRSEVVNSYKSEVLAKLVEAGAEKDLVEAVKKELKSEDIQTLLS